MTPSTSTSEELNLLASAITTRIYDTEAALKANDPQINTYCAQIHAQLLKCPELVYILKPEDIGTYIRTLAARAKIEVTKSPKPKTSALKNVSLDDL